jgi:hypothetical protein
MKTTKFTYLSLLILVGTVLVSRAEPYPYRTDINPALAYYRAFLMQPESMSQADWDYLASKKGKEQKLPERFGAIVASYDYQFELVRQAGHATVPCIWGTDLYLSPNVAMPHLGRAKAVARAVQVRVAWDLQHGRQDDARDDMLAAFVLGRNIASHPILIGALVQDAMESITYSTVAEHFSEFSPESLKQFVDGFDAAPARHTMADCMPSEKSMYDWLLRTIQELQKAYPNNDAKVMAGFRESGYAGLVDFTGDTNFWQQITVASGRTGEGLLKLAREMEPLFPRLTKIMALPQPEYEVQLKQLLADTRESQNPFSIDYLLLWQKIHFRLPEFRAQAQLAMVHAAAEYKLHGESGLKTVMDPFGNGPFGFQRFVFKCVDRGFELKSAYAGAEAPFAMIFVEKQGPAFQIIGPDAGKAIDK